MTENSLPKSEVTLIDVLNKWRRDTMLNMYCVQIGKIVEYKPLTNTAKVKILFDRELVTGAIIKYPVLDDCPVFIMAGGTSFVSCPIEPGDECLILFNDRNIDNWWVSGQTGVPPDGRVHDIADGMVLVGINSLANARITPLNSVCINGGSKKVSIKNSATDLKTLMNTLVDDISSLIDLVIGLTVIDAGTIVVPAGTWPIAGSTIVDLGKLKVKMVAYKTTVATLLDEGAL